MISIIISDHYNCYNNNNNSSHTQHFCNFNTSHSFFIILYFNAGSLDAVCEYFNAIDSAQYTNFVLLGDFNVDMSICSHPLFHK